jgi:hypothetical protein
MNHTVSTAEVARLATRIAELEAELDRRSDEVLKLLAKLARDEVRLQGLGFMTPAAARVSARQLQLE